MVVASAILSLVAAPGSCIRSVLPVTLRARLRLDVTKSESGGGERAEAIRSSALRLVVAPPVEASPDVKLWEVVKDVPPLALVEDEEEEDEDEEEEDVSVLEVARDVPGSPPHVKLPTTSSPQAKRIKGGGPSSRLAFFLHGLSREDASEEEAPNWEKAEEARGEILAPPAPADGSEHVPLL